MSGVFYASSLKNITVRFINISMGGEDPASSVRALASGRGCGEHNPAQATLVTHSTDLGRHRRATGKSHKGSPLSRASWVMPWVTGFSIFTGKAEAMNTFIRPGLFPADLGYTRTVSWRPLLLCSVGATQPAKASKASLKSPLHHERQSEQGAIKPCLMVNSGLITKLLTPRPKSDVTEINTIDLWHTGCSHQHSFYLSRHRLCGNSRRLGLYLLSPNRIPTARGSTGFPFLMETMLPSTTGPEWPLLRFILVFLSLQFTSI